MKDSYAMLISASEKVNLPESNVYKLAAKTNGFFRTGICMIVFTVACAIAYYLGLIDKLMSAANLPQIVLYLLASLPAFTLIYGIIILTTIGMAKVRIDEESISMPGFLPFMKEKIEWSAIENAEVREVMTPLGERIVFRFSSFAGGEPVLFDVLSQAKDPAVVLSILRKKLGKKLKIY